jgi:prepilin-type processing-associated H-X9-DG protein
MRRLAFLTTLLALAIPAFAQAPQSGADLQSLLSGKTFPLTRQLKDLNADWTRLTIGGSNDSGGVAAFYMAVFSGLTGSGGNVYYTQGQMVTIGTETYLVAYRASAKPVNFTALMRGGGQDNMPRPEPLTPDTLLSLSLVNLKNAGNLNDIRKFDLDKEIAEHKEANKPPTNETSESNLKQIAQGVIMYCQDYDEIFPPMKSNEVVKEVVMPYVKNQAIWIHPETKEPYQPNPALSYALMAGVSSPAETVLFYEMSAAPDNTRGVAFADGHVKRVPEPEWQTMETAMKKQKFEAHPPKPPKPQPPPKKPAPPRKPGSS